MKKRNEIKIPRIELCQFCGKKIAEGHECVHCIQIEKKNVSYVISELPDADVERFNRHK